MFSFSFCIYPFSGQNKKALKKGFCFSVKRTCRFVYSKLAVIFYICRNSDNTAVVVSYNDDWSTGSSADDSVDSDFFLKSTV